MIGGGLNLLFVVLPNINMMATALSKECYYKNQKTTGLTHCPIFLIRPSILTMVF